MATSVSSRSRASRGEFAWIVVRDPSWPVFMAWSMSRTSAAPHLTHDDTVRPHPEAVSHEIPLGYLALALDIGGSRFQAHHVFLLELEFCRVLYGDNSLSIRDEPGKNIQKGRLACACSSGNEDIQPCPDDALV